MCGKLTATNHSKEEQVFSVSLKPIPKPQNPYVTAQIDPNDFLSFLFLIFKKIQH